MERYNQEWHPIHWNKIVKIWGNKDFEGRTEGHFRTSLRCIQRYPMYQQVSKCINIKVSYVSIGILCINRYPNLDADYRLGQWYKFMIYQHTNSIETNGDRGDYQRMRVDGEGKGSSIKPWAHLHLKRVKMRKKL